jgi:hypothetical protein
MQRENKEVRVTDGIDDHAKQGLEPLGSKVVGNADRRLLNGSLALPMPRGI